VNLSSFAQQLRRAEIQKSESVLGRIGFGAVLEIVGFHQASDHGSVLVSLGFLGLDQVGQGEQITTETVLKFNKGASFPSFLEHLHSPHFGHHVHPHSKRFGMLAAEMDGVATPEVLQLEGREPR